MNTLYRRLALGAICVAVPMLVAIEPASAKTTACEAVKVASLDARLAAKADQGAAPLRRYVTRTQTVYGLDMTTALLRADRFRETRAACGMSGAS